ncbi:Glutamate or tyrosine decarboxylase [Agrococcus baldri]|uniref:Glutamate or tyrosine decarboxylase n=1 Tax=Agrococcus baldri TaxID=153730 RepID=A0AA94HL47_9MICO|nr:pyridoxal-dependent decarboxylase [Agrococcus baldri]SFS03559.1 Glutamate or tyrosine decarboxylase [Agrococcus baldri]
MSAPGDAYREPLDRARLHAQAWLDAVPERHVGPAVDVNRLVPQFARALPEGPSAAGAVVDELAALSEPGLMAMQSGRFFGWVIGGTLPVALAADWLVSAWDQNAGMRFATPATAAIEEAAGGWLLQLLGLPHGSDVGFTTGATMASFVGLTAGRQHLLQRAGWDLDRDGLFGAPRVRVLVGAQRHDVIDLALRYLGLGAPEVVPADAEGRMLPDALAEALDAHPGPSLVCLQAGNLHSGAFDPIGTATAIAHDRDAWVHVDGAFGLWAAVSPRWAEHLEGLAHADSWATDAHKTLNVPYDCGVAIVARPEASRAALGLHTSYLISDDHGPGDPFEKVPELSRRARGIPVWAALRSLGRSGVVELVEGLADAALALADGISAIPHAEVLNDVVFTQVCISFGSDERTRRVTQLLIDDGTAWMSGSQWRDRAVLRISVSNWATDDDDVRRSVDAVARAAARVPHP